MKKLLLVILLLISLCGCHGSKQTASFEVPETFDEDKTYELTFWAKNDTNKYQVAVYEQAIAEFEELYPNIKIKLRLYTDYGRIYNDVITNIQTGTTPDICITYPDHIATYLTGEDVVAPLDELLNDPKYGLGGSELRFEGVTKDGIIANFLNEGMINDRLYAVPFMRSSEACYINKTYVEALGYELPEVLTWDFMFEVAQKAMAKDEDGNFLINGQNILIPIIYKSTDNMMIQMLKQINAPYSDDNGNMELFNDATKAILKTVAEKADEGLFSTFKISSYPANFLNAGQCLFAIDSTAGATWMGSKAPLIDIAEDKLVDFETAVMTAPQMNDDNLKMISQGPSLCLFNKSDPDEVLASWLFVQYLLSDDIQIAYAQSEGYVPVTYQAQNSPEYLAYLNDKSDDADHYSVKLSATKLVLDHIDDTFVTPIFNGSASLRDAAGQLIENTVKSIRRGETVDDTYIDILFEDVKSLYHLDQLGSSHNQSPTDLGPLPWEAKLLIGALITIWVILGSSELYRTIKKKRS